ncbi:MAG: hypothetical protein ACK5MK_02670 [Dysgonomonas sp.]
MKKLASIFLLIICAASLTSCGDDDDNNKTPTNPNNTIVTFTYRVSNDNLSPIFNASFSYKDESGEMVQVENATLPWSKTITISRPFLSKIEGRYLLSSTATVPDVVKAGHTIQLSVNGLVFRNSLYMMSLPKENLDYWLNVGDKNNFSLEYNFDSIANE